MISIEDPQYVVADSDVEISRQLKTLIGDAVLVRLLPPDTLTRGGLHIPDTAKQNQTGYLGALADHQNRGVVIATGPGKRDAKGKLHPVECAPGDVVQFYFIATYADSLAWPDERYLFLPERYIQCVLEAS